jgi:hypothetical protein
MILQEVKYGLVYLLISQYGFWQLLLYILEKVYSTKATRRDSGKSEDSRYYRILCLVDIVKKFLIFIMKN